MCKIKGPDIPLFAQPSGFTVFVRKPIIWRAIKDWGMSLNHVTDCFLILTWWKWMSLPLRVILSTSYSSKTQIKIKTGLFVFYFDEVYLNFCLLWYLCSFHSRCILLVERNPPMCFKKIEINNEVEKNWNSKVLSIYVSILNNQSNISDESSNPENRNIWAFTTEKISLK